MAREFIILVMEIFTKDNFDTDLSMGKDFINMLQVINIMDNFKITLGTEADAYDLSMEMYIKEDGKEINFLEKENIHLTRLRLLKEFLNMENFKKMLKSCKKDYFFRK